MRDLEHGESWSATHVRTDTRRVTRQRGAVTDAAKGSADVAAAGAPAAASRHRWCRAGADGPPVGSATRPSTPSNPEPAAKTLTDAELKAMREVRVGPK